MNNDQPSSQHDAQIAHLPDPAPSREQHTKRPPRLPRAPRTVADTGLSETFLAALVLKSTLMHGRSEYADLIERHCLAISVLDDVLAFLVREHLVEITHRGTTDIDVSFRLTDAGRVLAIEEKARSSYNGPAPVTLDAYLDVIAAHSVRKLRIDRAEVMAAFDGIVIDPAIIDAAAASLNSGRPLLIHGPAGSGKTFFAERLGSLMGGEVPIPYAICVAGEIIQIYDPLVHADVKTQPEGLAVDRRWRLCERPIVMSGGELTLDELELRRDAGAGYYQAPPHMKANMGMYIVDDLGRQRVEPRDLLNRWLRPLDRGFDLLTLGTGNRFVVPFDVWPVFSSNIAPSQFGDDAFLRRLGSKLYVGPMAIEDYHAVFDAMCKSLGLVPASDAFDYLAHRLHLPTGKAFLACFPGDLLRLVAASARYRGDPPEVTHDGLHEAWTAYFGSAPERESPHPPSADRIGRTLASG
ncbi:ATP-binding protein [Burkholderia sp. Ac-20353]|uniref:ATP-binding protein n=1 Tax=Burkholderia sp. Ac-20353 TaxID=2703894 RepID=UPI00197BE319|nr:ATP-binding protein [Burkholderia sp. Ac-20353]MBN3791653.1 ATP-binding protein [Burkholderia sp. Ac-20353]